MNNVMLSMKGDENTQENDGIQHKHMKNPKRTVPMSHMLIHGISYANNFLISAVAISVAVSSANLLSPILKVSNV